MDICGKTQLAPQVGGHTGESTPEDGPLLIKPTLAREVGFHERLYGTLRFEGKVEDGTWRRSVKHQRKGKTSIILLGKPLGGQPCVCDSNAFDSIRGSRKQALEAEYPQHQARNGAFRR